MIKVLVVLSWVQQVSVALEEHVQHISLTMLSNVLFRKLILSLMISNKQTNQTKNKNTSHTSLTLAYAGFLRPPSNNN
jgi:hypothetical protein